MVKIIFENISASFYDNKTKELHIRTNFKDNNELSEILEHEIQHIIEDNNILVDYNNKWLGYAYEYLIKKKWLVVIIGLILSIWLQIYLSETSCQTALTVCRSYTKQFLD